jgi:PhzF family phenazine biosynthesis protein
MIRVDDKMAARTPSKIKTMRIPLFHVDAFAEGPFSGNPAAVCLLDSWLDDGSLRKVATENNLSATAFLVPKAGVYELRWFTTRCEIRLCGHATLAAGLVVLQMLRPDLQTVDFETRHGGLLAVQNDGDLLSMDFPALVPGPCLSPPQGLAACLGPEAVPLTVLEVNETYIAVLENEGVVASVVPDLARIEALHPFVVAITARGKLADFVSRYFAPSYGVPEDPVTGSLHCALTPYWSKQLGKTKMRARQLSERGGELLCEMQGDRVILRGKAVLTMQGTLTI